MKCWRVYCSARVCVCVCVCCCSVVESVDWACGKHLLREHRDDGGWDMCLSHGAFNASHCLIYVLDTHKYTYMQLLQ